MTNDDKREHAPEDTGEGSGLPRTKGRQALRKLTREISDDDLTNPAVYRLLLDDVDRLETENVELKQIRGDFYGADKRVAVLEEKQKSHTAFEIISGGCLTVGAAILGYAPVLWASQPSGVMAILLGSILITAGILAKAVKR
jgi:alpha-galactosidase